MESWREVDDIVTTPPPELLKLPEEDLRALLRIAEKLNDAGGGG